MSGDHNMRGEDDQIGPAYEECNSIPSGTFRLPLQKVDYASAIGTFTFAAPPKPVGYWKLGRDDSCCTMFSMYKKPTPEQIKNHLEMLGWEWMDAK